MANELERQTFSTGAVLSVTHGRLLCDFKEVHKLLSFMTGCELWTHHLPDAARVCAPELLSQFPEFRQLNVDHVSHDNWASFVREIYIELGHTRQVAPLPKGFYTPLSISEVLNGR